MAEKEREIYELKSFVGDMRNLIRDKLKLNVEPSDISASYRMGKNSGGHDNEKPYHDNR